MALFALIVVCWFSSNRLEYTIGALMMGLLMLIAQLEWEAEERGR